jgi:hypothetical protein
LKVALNTITLTQNHSDDILEPINMNISLILLYNIL